MHPVKYIRVEVRDGDYYVGGFTVKEGQGFFTCGGEDVFVDTEFVPIMDGMTRENGTVSRTYDQDFPVLLLSHLRTKYPHFSVEMVEEVDYGD